MNLLILILGNITLFFAHKYFINKWYVIITAGNSILIFKCIQFNKVQYDRMFRNF